MWLLCQCVCGDIPFRHRSVGSHIIGATPDLNLIRTMRRRQKRVWRYAVNAINLRLANHPCCKYVRGENYPVKQVSHGLDQFKQSRFHGDNLPFEHLVASRFPKASAGYDEKSRHGSTRPARTCAITYGATQGKNFLNRREQRSQRIVKNFLCCLCGLLFKNLSFRFQAALPWSTGLDDGHHQRAGGEVLLGGLADLLRGDGFVLGVFGVEVFVAQAIDFV